MPSIYINEEILKIKRKSIYLQESKRNCVKCGTLQKIITLKASTSIKHAENVRTTLRSH